MEELIERFWAEHEHEPLSPVASALYFRLLYEAEKRNWKGPVEISWRRLQLILNTSSNSLKQAISELTERGLITYSPNYRSHFWFPDASKHALENALENASKDASKLASKDALENASKHALPGEACFQDASKHALKNALPGEASSQHASKDASKHALRSEASSGVIIDNTDKISENETSISESANSKEEKEEKRKVSPHTPLLKRKEEKEENRDRDINNIAYSLTGVSVFAKSANTPEPPSEGPPKNDRTPYKQIVELYHNYCPSLPRVKVLTDTRKKYIRARWKEHPDLKFWEKFFKRVEASDFLTGRADYGKRRPFVADLEWLMRPNNFAKVLEGRYDNRDPVDPAQEEMIRKLQKIILEGG